MADILLVDDEEQVRSMLKMVLEDAGHSVQDAADGKEALECFARRPAAVVVTDIVMPNKEGIETIMELRRSSHDVKTIAMSGGGRNSPENYLKLAMKFGANLTLAKPFTNQEILDAVNIVLEM